MPTDGTLTVQLWREDDYHYLAVFGRFSKIVSLGRHTFKRLLCCAGGAERRNTTEVYRGKGGNMVAQSNVAECCRTETPIACFSSTIECRFPITAR